MSYRERQIRQILKQEQAKWGQEKGILQQDLLNLAKSIDAQVLNQEREKNEKLQKALDSLIATLGSEDIKNLADLKTLLKGQTLKSLLGIYQAKQESLENQLLNLAKQKLATKKEARELLSQLEEGWKQKEQEWKEQLENHQSAHNELFNEKSTLQETNQAQHTKITQLQEWSQGQHQRIQELEKQTTSQTQQINALQDLNQGLKGDYETYKKASQLARTSQEKELTEQKAFYTEKLQGLESQLHTEKLTITNLERQIHSSQEQNELLKAANQRAEQRNNQLEEYLSQSRQDGQNQQTTINSLNQDKVNLQTKITHLESQITEQTRLNGELNQTKNQLQTSLLEKEAKLAKHKNKKALTKEEIKHLTESITDYQEKQRASEERIRVLEEKEGKARQTLSQLLANREEELRGLEREENHG